MERHNSGVNPEVRSSEENEWISCKEAYFEEGRTYRIRILTDQPMTLVFAGVPQPLEKRGQGYEASIVMPFYSGKTIIELHTGVGKQEHPVYIYPDHRKITMENYFAMLEEIIREATVCFQETPTFIDVESSGKSRALSWLQWNYIEQCFSDLRKLFATLTNAPMKRLYRRDEMQRREKLKVMEAGTIRWLERQGTVRLEDRRSIPEYLMARRTFETCDIYENRMVKTQLMRLRFRLRGYEKITIGEISEKAKEYGAIVNHWLNRSYLKKVGDVQGSLRISQGMKKHPVYSLWHEWFEKLYNFKELSLGLSQPIPVSETYLVYEIWCYMKLVKWFREKGLVKNVRTLYKVDQNQLFLELAKGRRGEVRLVDGRRLIYQRSYQTSASGHFRSYTHMMIPDIVLESEEDIAVFDPKYRVDRNISNAMGEMHKYRDGIIDSEGRKSVKAAYILTPNRGEESERFFRRTYWDTYNMGAFAMNLETEESEMEELMGGINK